ncbi:MAG: sulfatase-like hydrolase/transferase [Planctomycetota bacterium]
MPRIILWISLFCWLGIACDSPPPPVPAKKKNLIVVTLDTTRADRLGCYGYDGNTTPFLDALAQDSIVFENAITPVPLTLPSHSTLFTGIYPLGHGVRANIAFQLPDEVQTLAEILKSESYETSAFVSAIVLDQKAGLSQGFDHYDQKFPMRQPKRNAEETFQAVQKWMLSRKTEQPFFLWVHLFDPHYPYEHPEPYKSQFPTSPYNGEIAFLDVEFGKFVELLKKRELYEDTILTVVGDHGESLGEHGEISHGYFAYDCTLKVPWILKLPNQLHSKRRISAQVRMIDVLPTLLHFLEIEPGPKVQGMDLAPFFEEKSSFPELVAYSETYYPFYQYGFAPIEVLRTASYKLVDTVPVELYDLQTDRDETKDVSKTHPELVKSLKEKLQIQKETYSRAIHAESEPDEKTLAQLGALGYISSRRVSPNQAERLSPKENVVTHENMMKIYSEMEKQSFPKAQDYMSRVLLSNPDLPIALELQLEIFLKTKQYPKASTLLQRLLKTYPDEPHFLYKLAQCYHSENDVLQAITVLKKILTLVPNYEEVYQTLWLIYVQNKRFEEAHQEIQARLQNHPDSGFCWRWLGKIFEAQGNLEEAEKAILAPHKWPINKEILIMFWPNCNRIRKILLKRWSLFKRF